MLSQTEKKKVIFLGYNEYRNTILAPTWQDGVHMQRRRLETEQGLLYRFKCGLLSAQHLLPNYFKIWTDWKHTILTYQEANISPKVIWKGFSSFWKCMQIA